MARYIDEKDVYKLVEPTGVARVHCSQIDELPRADVVPKSEVDSEIKVWQDLYADTVSKWEKAYEELEIKLENAKAEATREIFEEIEEAKERWEAIYSSDHFGFGGGAYGYLETDVDHTIYELKNKYTENIE